MDDIKEEVVGQDGVKFRLTVFDSSSVPLGHVRYQIEMLVELDGANGWWYSLKRSRGMLLDEAFRDGRYYLNWYAENATPEMRDKWMAL